MRKALFATLALSAFSFGMTATATAAPITTIFTSSSPHHDAINDNGAFHVGQSLFSADPGVPNFFTWSSDFELGAQGPGYSDAGVVLFFDGGLTLGELNNVKVLSTGSPVGINLWFDTGGDGNYFAFGGISGTLMTGLNGDSYGGVNGPFLMGGFPIISMFGGNGAGNNYTLGQLQSGAVSGINGNTSIALWVGITNPGGQQLYTQLNSISVATNDVAAVPEPTSMALLGTGLLGLVAARRRRKQ